VSRPVNACFSCGVCVCTIGRHVPAERGEEGIKESPGTKEEQKRDTSPISGRNCVKGLFVSQPSAAREGLGARGLGLGFGSLVPSPQSQVPALWSPERKTLRSARLGTQSEFAEQNSVMSRASTSRLTVSGAGVDMRQENRRPSLQVKQRTTYG